MRQLLDGRQAGSNRLSLINAVTAEVDLERRELYRLRDLSGLRTFACLFGGL